MASDAAAVLQDLAEQVRPVALRSEQPTLPVLPALEGLVPAGLTRGTTAAVGAAAGVAGATALALALAAGPSRAGAWVALVGRGGAGAGGGRRGGWGRGGRGRGGAPGEGGGGDWGLVTAADLGVALERLVVVAPAERPAGGWGPVVAALVDGFPVVVLGPEVQLRGGDDRRLAARLRERGGVLVRAGGDGVVPGPAHLRLLVTASEWSGIDRGAGHLRARRLVVEATGRGSAARPRRAELLLPGPTGEAVAVPVSREPGESRGTRGNSVRQIKGEEIGAGGRHLFPQPRLGGRSFLGSGGRRGVGVG